MIGWGFVLGLVVIFVTAAIAKKAMEIILTDGSIILAIELIIFAIIAVCWLLSVIF